MKRALDSIDYAILKALQEDGRLSNKELAAKVNLAPSSCLERVRRLRDENVLRGVHAEVDPRAIGIGIEALVAIRLRHHGRDAMDAFRAHILAQREVLALYYVAGADDFLVHVAVRDTDHLRDFGLDAFTARPEVAHMETSLIFDYTRRWELPVYAEEE